MPNLTDSLPTQHERLTKLVDTVVTDDLENAFKTFALCLREEYRQRLIDAIDGYQYWMTREKKHRETIAEQFSNVGVGHWTEQLTLMARKPTKTLKATGLHVDPDEQFRDAKAVRK